MIQSVYIHIPFCAQICHYCDFTKFFYNEKAADDYLEALEKEINTSIIEPKQKVKTIFIGGGTPTALNVEQLKRLMTIIDHAFSIKDCREFSIEANPGDFSADKMDVLKAYGINRISLGVQVFDDELLTMLNRSHKIKDVYETIDNLHKYQFGNVSLDMIYALPTQTVEKFSETLDMALDCDFPHYSAYGLQIEPKTVFYQRYKKGKLHKPPEEVEAEMYNILRQKMKENGLYQYEISNFAKKGFESKHNLTYWNNDYYYGFGAGAHAYLPGKRISNIKPLPAYLKKANEDGKPQLHIEEITLKEQIEEEMFLGLRKTQGVNVNKFQTRFGFSYEDIYKQKIDMLIKKGWLKRDETGISLTHEGMLFGNNVFAEFLIDAEINLVR